MWCKRLISGMMAAAGLGVRGLAPWRAVGPWHAGRADGRTLRSPALWLVLAACVALSACGHSPAERGGEACAGPRIIVKLAGSSEADPARIAQGLSRVAGIDLVYERTLATGAHVLCAEPVSDERATRAAARLRRSEQVGYVELGRVLRAR